MDLLQRVLMPMSSGTLNGSVNHIRPTYARDTIGSLNLRPVLPVGLRSGNMSSFAMGAVAGAVLQNGLSGKDRSGNHTAQQSHPQQQGYPPPQSGSAQRNRPPQTQGYNTVQPCYSAQQSGVQSSPVRAPLPRMQVPTLRVPVQRGQKVSLPTDSHPKLRVGFGWNVNDSRCDVDASVFALDGTGCVPNDDWLIFYGAPESPDKAIVFHEQGAPDRQAVTLDIDRLSKSITKLVIVLTLYEPFETNVNFSMISDAYLRVTDAQTGYELVSFCVNEYFENVTSMTLGELYYRNGQWKFNPVGNGVRQDLAGQCAIYGVAISE